MPLPSSGAVRLGADVDVILGFSSTTQISLGATGVRTLYGVASGAIRLATDGYGKSPAGGASGASGASGAGGGGTGSFTTTFQSPNGDSSSWGFGLANGLSDATLAASYITGAGKIITIWNNYGDKRTLTSSGAAFVEYGMFLRIPTSTSSTLVMGDMAHQQYMTISNAAVQYNLNSSMIMANSFTLYFVSTLDADAAATAMTSGTTFTLWDASGGKYTGTLNSMPGSHSPGSNTVYHSFSSNPSYIMDMSGITNRVQIG
jgi:hypothetical protein